MIWMISMTHPVVPFDTLVLSEAEGLRTNNSAASLLPTAQKVY
jgi:hypothetical protein